jgi:hypothetical protein
MSQGVFCRNPVEHRSCWTVIQRHSRCSAFDGYRHMWSPYSAVRCSTCGAVWRTKAAYVAALPNAPADWFR